MGEGPAASSSSAAGGSAFAKGPDDSASIPTFNIDDLRKVIQEQELAQQTSSEGRRIPCDEALEVDAKISLERERILEQENLMKKVNSNPWFLSDQGLTRLKWPTGAYVLSDLGDGRAKTTSWFEVPANLKQSLSDMGPDGWVCHPLSGWSVHFFLKAPELGKWQGNLRTEMQKESVYTRLDKAGYPGTGYKSGFGFLPDFLNRTQIHAEFIDFPAPGPKGKRAKEPSPTDLSDEDYAEAWEKHRQYLHEIAVHRRFERIRQEFNFVVDCVAELCGEDLFKYLRLNQDNH